MEPTSASRDWITTAAFIKAGANTVAASQMIEQARAKARRDVRQASVRKSALQEVSLISGSEDETAPILYTSPANDWLKKLTPSFKSHIAGAACVDAAV